MTEKEKKHEIIGYLLGLIHKELRKNPDISLLLDNGEEITRKQIISFIIELENNANVNIPSNPRYDIK